MTVAMSCVTSALHHEDIILHISPLFASIPEIQCTNTSDPEEMTLSAKPNFLAVNGIHLVTPKVIDDPNPPPIAPKFTTNRTLLLLLLNLRTTWTLVPWILILWLKQTLSGTLQLQVTS